MNIFIILKGPQNILMNEIQIFNEGKIWRMSYGDTGDWKKCKPPSFSVNHQSVVTGTEDTVNNGVKMAKATGGYID